MFKVLETKRNKLFEIDLSTKLFSRVFLFENVCILIFDDFFLFNDIKIEFVVRKAVKKNNKLLISNGNICYILDFNLLVITNKMDCINEKTINSEENKKNTNEFGKENWKNQDLEIDEESIKYKDAVCDNIVKFVDLEWDEDEEVVYYSCILQEKYIIICNDKTSTIYIFNDKLEAIENEALFIVSDDERNPVYMRGIDCNDDMIVQINKNSEVIKYKIKDTKEYNVKFKYYEGELEYNIFDKILESKDDVENTGKGDVESIGRGGEESTGKGDAEITNKDKAVITDKEASNIAHNEHSTINIIENDNMSKSNTVQENSKANIEEENEKFDMLENFPKIEETQNKEVSNVDITEKMENMTILGELKNKSLTVESIKKATEESTVYKNIFNIKNEENKKQEEDNTSKVENKKVNASILNLSSILDKVVATKEEQEKDTTIHVLTPVTEKDKLIFSVDSIIADIKNIRVNKCDTHKIKYEEYNIDKYLDILYKNIMRLDEIDEVQNDLENQLLCMTNELKLRKEIDDDYVKDCIRYTDQKLGQKNKYKMPFNYNKGIIDTVDIKKNTEHDGLYNIKLEEINNINIMIENIKLEPDTKIETEKTNSSFSLNINKCNELNNKVNEQKETEDTQQVNNNVNGQGIFTPNMNGQGVFTPNMNGQGVFTASNNTSSSIFNRIINTGSSIPVIKKDEKPVETKAPNAFSRFASQSNLYK